MHALLMVGFVALVLRLLAAWMLGPGPFGPDGPGAEAAVVLGGHPYPLHPLLIRCAGDIRLLSILSGLVTALAAGSLSRRLGFGPWGGGLLAACAPLLVHHAALAGGDAPATALAACALALAAGGRPLLAGLAAVAALATKPIVAPALLGLLVLAPASHKRPALALGLVLLPLSSVLGTTLLDPLLRPKPGMGMLGSWFLATGGEVQFGANWTIEGFLRLWRLPTWTGHPLLGGLALVGALWPGPRRRLRLTWLALAALAMLATSTFLGDSLRPRYLAAASLPLVVLAGCSLKRGPWLALLLAWPALAVVDGLAEVRALEDPGAQPHPLGLPWPGERDSRGQFMDSSICRASELRALVEELRELPPNSTVHILQLRDGREGELRWPLMATRPDLDPRIVTQRSPSPFVAPASSASVICSTPVTHWEVTLSGPGVYSLSR